MKRASYRSFILSCLLVITGCQTLTDFFIQGQVRTDREKIGEVDLIAGSPLVLRGGTMISLRKGSKIHVKDTIFTDDNAKLRIEMSDGTLVTLGNNSQFVFHVYSYRDPAPIARMSFTEGSFRISTDRFMKRDAARFEVTTPLAVIGVRGTDFWGGFIFGDNELDVALLSEGGIYITNDQGSVDITRPGYGTTVKFGAAPTTPEQWPTLKAFRAVESTAI